MVRSLRYLWTVCLIILLLASSRLFGSDETDAALVAQYHLDEFDGATSFLDSSFSGNNGSCTGATCPTMGKMGVFSSAARFDGADDYITVSDNINLDNTSTLSVQAWVFPTTLNGQADGIVSKRNGANSGQAYSLFFYTSSRLYVDIETSNDRFFTTTSFTANRWYHLVVTYEGAQASGTRVRVYVNGVEDAGSPFSESSATLSNANSPLILGMLNAAYGNGLHGYLDEVSVYRAVLSDADVERGFRSGAWRVHSEYLGKSAPFGSFPSTGAAPSILSGLWKLFPFG